MKNNELPKGYEKLIEFNFSKKEYAELIKAKVKINFPKDIHVLLVTIMDRLLNPRDDATVSAYDVSDDVIKTFPESIAIDSEYIHVHVYLNENEIKIYSNIKSSAHLKALIFTNFVERVLYEDIFKSIDDVYYKNCPIRVNEDNNKKEDENMKKDNLNVNIGYAPKESETLPDEVSNNIPSINKLVKKFYDDCHIEYSEETKPCEEEPKSYEQKTKESSTQTDDSTIKEKKRIEQSVEPAFQYFTRYENGGNIYNVNHYVVKKSYLCDRNCVFNKTNSPMSINNYIFATQFFDYGVENEVLIETNAENISVKFLDLLLSKILTAIIELTKGMNYFALQELIDNDFDNDERWLEINSSIYVLNRILASANKMISIQFNKVDNYGYDVKLVAMDVKHNCIFS